ncbi:hypothetical protein CsSME_00051278 [Camellia sinensis var. sinensis]
MAKRCKEFLFWVGLVCLGVHTGRHTHIHNTQSRPRCIHNDRFGHTPKGPLTHTRLREGKDYTQQPQHLSISILTQVDRTHRIVDSTTSILREWKPRVRIDDRLIEPYDGVIVVFVVVFNDEDYAGEDDAVVGRSCGGGGGGARVKVLVAATMTEADVGDEEEGGEEDKEAEGDGDGDGDGVGVAKAEAG